MGNHYSTSTTTIGTVCDSLASSRNVGVQSGDERRNGCWLLVAGMQWRVSVQPRYKAIPSAVLRGRPLASLNDEDERARHRPGRLLIVPWLESVGVRATPARPKFDDCGLADQPGTPRTVRQGLGTVRYN
ncbi:uncharacterized protein B0H18DRAFT_271648 [Fomitopsis serialis]|uniref:uncharacterized protein n=1 Tax=Fomitopsis serialis TaxID=139415 RepID=UPI0020081339|nr:uncharacterized protein B0H18DRAFT_624788 [Neoantrodia serialis]XP_047894361.1 uncharacterized protein B0H18DRAFT_271648 [Neoantrodia serialis]KAH9919676.1 hypothetical protein B0H18DRAFT_624788 [Neoantrodia serialis]KAH9927718.1 hypothetical protein B0H18DRAFT_271648 [Neoantrodia serialis]